MGEENNQLYYYHGDHLGSAQIVTDPEGEIYEQLEYTPYGELWVEHLKTTIETTPFRFTGKERDSETGLYYFGARYLNPQTSMWLSADPAMGEYIPQAPVNDEAKQHNKELPGMGGVFNYVNLHAYHYAGNNPIKLVDPNGRDDEIYDLSGNLVKSIKSETNDIYILKPNIKRGYAEPVLLENCLRESGVNLTIEEIGNIIFNETRSLSGKRVQEARENVAHVVINGAIKFGSKRDSLAGTASTSVTDIAKKQDSRQYLDSQKAARKAILAHLTSGDPTNGSVFLYIATNNSRVDFQSGKIQTQVGPLNNSFPYGDVPARSGIYINTYKLRSE
jgi:RHS repeat-associated protein